MEAKRYERIMLKNKQTHRNGRELINLGLAETSIASYFESQSTKVAMKNPTNPRITSYFHTRSCLPQRKLAFDASSSSFQFYFKRVNKYFLWRRQRLYP